MWRWQLQHGRQLRRTVLIHRQHQVLQRYIVSVVLGEKGAHRPVDDAICEDGVLGSLSLTLVKSARDLSDSVHSLIVLNAQREEINALPGFLRCGCRTKNRRVAIVHEHSAVGLLGHSVHIDTECSSG